MSPRTTAVTCLAVLMICAVAWARLSVVSGDALRSPASGERELEEDVDRLEARLEERDELRSIGPPADRPTEPGTRAEPLVWGRIVDRFGTPVGGAAVRLELRSSQPGGDRVREPVATGPDGRFAFRGRGREGLALTLRVRAEGHAPLLSDHVLESASGRLDVGDLALLDGGGLRGRVTDLAERAIPGVEITLQPIAVNPLTRPSDRVELLPPAVSDTSGAYAFTHLMAGTYRVEASAPGWQRRILRDPILVEDGRTGEIAPIRLGPAFELAGTVFGPGGTPIPGAKVRVRSEELAHRFDERSRSDPVGQFHFAHVPGVPVTVSVHAEGMLRWQRKGLDPRLGQPLAIRLQEGLGIRGTVLDARSGAPVERFAAGVRRVGSRKSGERIDLGPPVDRPGGTFAFEGLDEGMYAVDVLSPDHQLTRSAAISLSLETGSQRGVQVVVERGVRIGGIVVSKGDGAPLSAVRVDLSEGLRGHTVMSRMTDSNGRFAFENAPAGEYFLTVRHRERETVYTDPFQLAADRDGMRIEVGAAATLYGQVRGVPPGGRDPLYVLAFGGTGVTRTARVGPDGSYRLDGLQPGDYAVRAFAGHPRIYPVLRPPHFLDLGNRPIDVTLKEGERRKFDPVLDVPPQGAVAGTVTVNGGPASGFRVEVRAGDLPDMVGWVRHRPGIRTARLDLSGRFELADLPAGSYLLTVTNRSRQAVYRQRLTVRAESATRVDAHLSTGVLRGRVTASDAAPEDPLDGSLSVLPGATAAPEDLRSYGRGNLVVEARVQNGRFEVREVPAGPALIVLRLRGRVQAATPIVIQPGSTAEVELPAGDLSR